MKKPINVLERRTLDMVEIVVVVGIHSNKPGSSVIKWLKFKSEIKTNLLAAIVEHISLSSKI